MLRNKLPYSSGERKIGGWKGKPPLWPQKASKFPTQHHFVLHLALREWCKAFTVEGISFDISQVPNDMTFFETSLLETFLW